MRRALLPLLTALALTACSSQPSTVETAAETCGLNADQYTDGTINLSLTTSIKTADGRKQFTDIQCTLDALEIPAGAQEEVMTKNHGEYTNKEAGYSLKWNTDTTNGARITVSELD
ncbi:hypothetical protein [Dermabacter hominis]|uniref:hypothetical protein n=1 Tax=Dermabacter hominis TaxID=36740 RepID=UPI0021A2D762|nr:hypothetical protein [Dermabacter hominis]MCT1806824.1 hypothetical protein [Dermabacter hominis]